MPKKFLSALALLVAVFLVALAGGLAGNAVAEVGQAAGVGEASSTAGPRGADGQKGADGQDGAEGSDGIAGPAGERGAPGVRGPAGRAGADGEQGATGAQGADGAAGLNGSPGPVGPVGPAGPPGQNGMDGADGSTSVRVDFHRTFGFDGNSLKMLELSPGWKTGQWLIELDWNVSSGGGVCDLKVGSTNFADVKPGFMVAETISGSEEVSVSCRSNSPSVGFNLEHATLRATRIG